MTRRMRKSFVSWPASAILLALAGCSQPVQYGGLIPVDGAGFASRIEKLCRAGLVARAGETCAAPRVVITGGGQ